MQFSQSPSVTRALPYLAMVAAMVVYGLSIVLSRAVHADIPPAGLTFWRYFAATALILPFVIRDFTVKWPVLVARWRTIVSIAMLQAVVGQVLFYLGLHTTTATNAGLIVACQPALVVLFANAVLGDPIGRIPAIGLVAAATGALVIVMRGDIEALLGLDLVIGDLWIALGILCWALYAIEVRRVVHEIGPVTLMAAMSVVSTVLLLPVYAVEMAWFDAYVRLDWLTVGSVVFFAIFPSILALSLTSYGIAQLGPGRAGAFSYLTPPFTVIAATLLLDERIELYHGVGMALILVGVFLASRRRLLPRAQGTPVR